MDKKYTSQLHAGVGMVEETIALLDLWSPSLDTSDLYLVARNSGQFSSMSARRIKNFIFECFSPRYLVRESEPAKILKSLKSSIAKNELIQLLFLYTCRDNLILRDFINQVYWPAYSAGRNIISNEDAREYVNQAVQEGKTTTFWSVGTIKRVAPYLTSTCSDFGLLESGAKKTRRILHFRIEPLVALLLAYELHFLGLGDNQITNNNDWYLFGLDSDDVLEELKKFMLMDTLIVQSAGGISKISWNYKSMEDLIDVISNGGFR